MTKKIEEKRKLTIEIKGVTYPLRFGIKFLKEINNEEDGLLVAVAGLLENDTMEVFRLLKAAMNTYDDVTEEQLEEYIENDADMDRLVEDFLLILQAMNTTRKTVKASLPHLKRIQDNQAKMRQLNILEMELEIKLKEEEQNPKKEPEE